MRLRSVRSTVVPLQCATFDGVNDYFNRSAAITGMTFTDDWAMSAWVKLGAYPASGSLTPIATRTPAGGANGFSLWITDNGQVVMNGRNAAAGNFSRVISVQSIPLNEWVHITAQHDMSAFTVSPTTSYIMINGQDVPATVSRSGTMPTALVQSGNIEIGAMDGATFFYNGKIAQVAIYNAKITQATAKAAYSQGLLGSEANLAALYTLSNSLNDLTTNANNLTANGGVLATTNDAPWGIQGDGTNSATVEHAIIQKATYSAPDTTVVVQTPKGGTLPTSGGIASVSYSQFKTPYQFPAQEGRWTIQSLYLADILIGAPAANTWYNFGGAKLTAPIGEWVAFYKGNSGADRGGAGRTDSAITLSTGSSSESNKQLTASQGNGNAGIFSASNMYATEPISAPIATDYFLNGKTSVVGISNLCLFGGSAWSSSIISMKNAYL